MNISTKCNCCIKEDVCKYKNDYEAAKKAILDTTWETSRGGIATLKGSQIISVSIKCDKMLPQSATPRGANL